MGYHYLISCEKPLSAIIHKPWDERGYALAKYVKISYTAKQHSTKRSKQAEDQWTRAVSRHL
jgi:hypothetical protein